LRITGGQAKGIPLKVNTGLHSVRPATDRMRESVFASLQPYLQQIRFLDLFAGFGSYGLEALSRGAREGILIEKDRRAVELIRQNIKSVTKSVGCQESAVKVCSCDVFKWKPASGECFDLIIADPPYGLFPDVLAPLYERAASWLAPDGIFLLEAPGHLELVRPGWECSRRFGKGAHEPTVSVLRRESQSQ